MGDPPNQDTEAPLEPDVSTISDRSHRGGRREALTWPIGAAFLLVLLLTFGAGVWWVARSAALQSQDHAVQRTQALAGQLSMAAQPLLAEGELSAVHRLLSESALQNGFETCQLRLADDRVLVDVDLSSPQMTELPPDLPQASEAVARSRVVAGRVFVTRPLPVPGHGHAELHLEAPLPAASAALGPALPGAGVIGAIGLAGMFLIYRKLRARLGVLTMIHGALRDAEEGAGLGGLRLDPRWGHEAAGWNRILERQDAREEAGLDRELEQAERHAGTGGPLEAGCDGLWQGLAVFDGRGRLAYANGAACAALGWDREQALGCALDEVQVEDEVHDAIREAYLGHGPARATIERDRVTGDAASVLRHTVRPVGQGQAEAAGALLLIEDITQQRVAESSRHDFVAQATHELRSPLTNIRMYLETALEEGQDDPAMLGECLNIIGRESQRLERLVGEMLSVSEIEAGAIALNRDDIRLDALFKELQADYAAQAQEQQIQLSFDLPPKLPVVQGDRAKFAVVLQNLLGNAVKYTVGGGEVRVSVEVSPGELIIEVSDTGIGISEEDQARVFEKFTRANDPRIGDITGSGLGLALAREIVRLHGGDLTVESELDKGSTFRVAMPINAEGV